MQARAAERKKKTFHLQLNNGDSLQSYSCILFLYSFILSSTCMESIQLRVVNSQGAGEAAERARSQRKSLQISLCRLQTDFNLAQGSSFQDNQSL